ncbi:hypothetical protein A3194_10170 [Candidatus Thiodiazotropha endoloripes]|uniref:hypothetical protein n=1 Tax=Candidatus Thiodiazotropha endoloripes TaxID=1818881 RepID=UPI00083E312A|nr:hypothetical protein [Candidatus Thiodiazotropha endoloripes]ODB89522.1 hypothetical protein A3194_10170 [Candidatus Thiodiazotropha endoloripes]
MLNYLFEKSQERKQLKGALAPYGLGLSDLDPIDLKKLLCSIHRHITLVSKKYGQPSSGIQHQVITPVVWATAYCLLGGSRIVQIEPGFRDIIDEVETELVLHLSGESSDNQSIYPEIFSTLLASDACHPEVLAFVRNLVYISHTVNQQRSLAG